MKILLVEDNIDQASFIRQSLEAAGHQTDVTENGQTGLLAALQTEYHVIITDRMMPQMDGLQMLKALRAAGNQTPVLILSALDSVEERVEGLRSGGDDYLIKPFAFSELLARIEILSRRTTKTETEQKTGYQLDTLSLDLLSRKATRGRQLIQLNTREFQILEYFMSNTGRVITRTMLLERVWNHHFDPQTNVIDVHISRLRKKIDIEGHKPLLHTVRGAGYVMEVRV
ncbi:response regulator transcription factor [Vibrio sp. SCSIO 43137]|uniref:response regulator transcription factor n=1 Tax=Vibrio sp. SCSIO 43137 TaxID=3021011 RepID=UPI00230732E1|nr:response regulator transcription factor [Vibrio sp. SCSIO 43137]WCE31853.1 response regulator transcription factor [Vibrio sp. SCSIO 43137]